MRILLLTSLLILATLYAEAQIRGDIRLQLGSEYAFSTDAFGVNFGAEYFLTNNISFAPNYTHFIPEHGRASSLNVDARYYLTEDVLQWYGLLGFTNNWATDELIGIENQRRSTTGANVGLGGVLKFADRLAFNPELKYQIHHGGQFVFKLGLVFILI